MPDTGRAPSGPAGAGAGAQAGAVHPRAALPTQANRFDAASAQPGDTIGGLRMAAVELQEVPAEPGVRVGSVRFEGELALTGAWGPNPGYPETRLTCFYPDPVSASRLPRMDHDLRRVWLCFSNPAIAHERLGEPGTTGDASITIRDYTTVYRYTDAFDTAELVEVREREPR